MKPLEKLFKKQTHGTVASYRKAGCRCKECKKAHNEQTKKTRDKNREVYNKQARELYHAKKTKV